MSNGSIDRRTLLVAGAAAVVSQRVSAQASPTGRIVRVLVAFPAGQATDTVARLMAERLQKVTGDHYIVENKPGQGGSLGLGVLAKSPPDGSVMMLGHMSALATNPHLYKSVPYDSLKDFEAISLVGDLPFVLVCHPSLPFSNVQELIQYAKANPDRLTNASSGNGTVSHLAMEELKRRAGIKILHVPYKGSGPGLTDVMGGNVSIALETANSVQPFVQAGKLRLLGAGTANRLTGVLNVPTIAEQGFPNFKAVTWLMALFPAGTPATTVKGMFGAIHTAMRDPAVEQRLLGSGVLPRFSASPEEAAAYIRSEYKNWGEVVKRSGIQLD